MTIADFRRLALSLEGAEEASHMGSPDFRVGGKIFATLASQKQGYGNLMLSPEMQAELVGEEPEIFIPVNGNWGKMGATHLKLALAHEDLVEGALRMAWRLRIEKNKQDGKRIPAEALQKLRAKKAAAKKPVAKKPAAKKR